MTANSIDAALASENEVIVNEIVHDNSSSFADSFDPNTGDTNTLQVHKYKLLKAVIYFDFSILIR